VYTLQQTVAFVNFVSEIEKTINRKQQVWQISRCYRRCLYAI